MTSDAQTSLLDGTIPSPSSRHRDNYCRISVVITVLCLAAHHFLVMLCLRHPGFLQSLQVYLTKTEWTSVFARHLANTNICKKNRDLQEKLPRILLIQLMFSAILVYLTFLVFGCQIYRELPLELTPCFIIQPHPQTLDSAGGESAGFTVFPNTTYLSLILNLRMMDK